MLSSEKRKNDMFSKDKKKDGAELDLNAGVLAPVKTFVPVTGQKPGVQAQKVSGIQEEKQQQNDYD